jgi:hypothetical protein
MAGGAYAALAEVEADRAQSEGFADIEAHRLPSLNPNVYTPHSLPTAFCFSTLGCLCCVLIASMIAARPIAMVAIRKPIPASISWTALLEATKTAKP